MSQKKQFVPLVLAQEKDRLVEVRPGQKVVPLPEGQVPRIAVASWQPAGDGTYRPVAKVRERSVKLNKECLAQLRIGVSVHTMKRLILGGFVAGGKVSPQVWSFDVASYEQHERNVYEDPDFWDKCHPDKNLERFMRTVGG